MRCAATDCGFGWRAVRRTRQGARPAGGTRETGFATLWGEGAITRFDGRDGELTVDGEVSSAMLGADRSHGRGTAGVVIAHSRGAGEYRSPGGDVEVASTLTGLYPYGRYEANERLALWGVAGYGEGELVLTPEDAPALETDMDLTMASAGLKGTLRDGGGDGLFLALEADGLAVRGTSDGIPGLVAADSQVTRLRLGLEGSWQGLALAGGALTPSAEIGGAPRRRRRRARLRCRYRRRGRLVRPRPRHRGATQGARAAHPRGRQFPRARLFGLALLGPASGLESRTVIDAQPERWRLGDRGDGRAVRSRDDGGGVPPTTMAGSSRDAVSRRRSATGYRCSATGSSAPRRSASDSPTATASCASAGVWASRGGRSGCRSTLSSRRRGASA